MPGGIVVSGLFPLDSELSLQFEPAARYALPFPPFLFAYALEALERYGAARARWLVLARLAPLSSLTRVT